MMKANNNVEMTREQDCCVVLHIPHSSKNIPKKYKGLFYGDEYLINQELIKMTDSYTEDLFDVGFEKIVFRKSRLICDVERFRDEKKEPMSKKGMWICYTKDHNLLPLKKCTKKHKEEMLRLYDDHHKCFEQLVEEKLKKYNKCIIIDCHSFSSRRLTYETYKSIKRPDFCIGMNDDEGREIVDRIISRIKEEKKEVYIDGEWVKKDYTISVNDPFSSAIKPMKFINDKRVISIMMEVNRYLYMDEVTGTKNGNFDRIKQLLLYSLINVDGHNDNYIRNCVNYLSTHLVANLVGACISSQLWFAGATHKDFDEIHKDNSNY